MKLKSTKEYIDYPILPCIASVIGFSVFFVPDNWYVFKTVGIIIYNLILFRDTIKKLLSKHNKMGDDELKK